MRKLLHQVFGIWTSGQLYDPDYHPAQKIDTASTSQDQPVEEQPEKIWPKAVKRGIPRKGKRSPRPFHDRFLARNRQSTSRCLLVCRWHWQSPFYRLPVSSQPDHDGTRPASPGLLRPPAGSRPPTSRPLPRPWSETRSRTHVLGAPRQEHPPVLSSTLWRIRKRDRSVVPSPSIDRLRRGTPSGGNVRFPTHPEHREEEPVIGIRRSRNVSEAKCNRQIIGVITPDAT